MSLLQLILIALLQGTTEWLPISSSGHVLLAAELFALEGRDELLINAVSNLGTLLALLIYFHKDVREAVLGGLALPLQLIQGQTLSRGAYLALCILVATPFALCAAILHELFRPQTVQLALRSVWTVAGATIIFGLFLWWADIAGGRNRSQADMTLWHAVWIGASQAVAALIPGTSRSGITMTVARALGYARLEAASFSMLIGAPITAAAGLYGLTGLIGAEAGPAVVTLQDGLIVAVFAFLSGIVSIHFLMSLLKRLSFLPFVIYRLCLGAALLLLSPVLGLI